MFTRLLEKAKEIYVDRPCLCRHCGFPLPFYHHRDHLCDDCNQTQIESEFEQRVFEDWEGHNAKKDYPRHK